MTSDDHRTPDDPSGAPAPEAPHGAAGASQAPDAESLEGIATPATVRRAPRIGAFIRLGVVLGAVVGLVLALVGSGTEGEGRTAVLLLSTVGCAGTGALLGAAVAGLVDRRSGRRLDRRSGR